MRRSLAISVAVVLALTLGLAIPTSWRLWAHDYVSIWLLLAILSIVVAGVCSALADRPACRKARPVSAWMLSAAILSGALTANQLAQLPPDYRVMSDEANVVATSKAIFEHQRATRSFKGLYDERGNYHDHVLVPDKRPLAFPVLLSAVHAAIGYSPHNGFVLNAGLGMISLVLLIGVLRFWYPMPLALAGAVLLAATPAYAFSVSSSGVDVLNLTCILGTLLAALVWLRDGREQQLVLALLIAAVLASVRNESLVLAAILSFGMVVIQYRRHGSLPNSMVLVIVAWLPVLWHLAMPYDHERGADSVVGSFSLTHLSNHAVQMIRAFLFDGGLHGVPRALGWSAVVGFILLVLDARRLRGTLFATDQYLLLALAAAGSAATLAIVLSYWSGNFTEPTTLRYTLPWLLVATVLACHLGSAITRRFRFGSLGAVIAVSLYWVGGTMDTARNVPMSSIEMGRAYRESLRVLDGVCQARDCAVVTQFTGWYGIHGYAVLSEGDVLENRDLLNKQRASGVLSNLYVVDIHALGAAPFIRVPVSENPPSVIYSKVMGDELVLSIGSMR